MTAHTDHQVVLLHGLARSSASMRPLASFLTERGFNPCNIDYPSRQHPIETLASTHVLPQIRQHCPYPEKPLHFVTHSLGGIIVRQLAQIDPKLNIGRVVMLAPPNHGSEIVDKLSDLSLFTLINGPVGEQLSTHQESLPNRLGAAHFEVGIITGTRTINPLLSLLIEGDNDGKVSTESAKLEGMADFLVMPVSHPFILQKPAVWLQVEHFLNHGLFQRADTPTR